MQAHPGEPNESRRKARQGFIHSSEVDHCLEVLAGGFDITEVPDTAAAEQLILDRQVYGAIDLSSGAPQVIVASAASTAVAQTLQTLATGLGQAGKPGTPAAVRDDLAALPADDPRGAGLSAGALPLVMGGLLAAVLFVSVVIWRRLNARTRPKCVDADGILDAPVAGTGEARGRTSASDRERASATIETT